MKKYTRGIALLGAATLATGLTACTKEEAIQEYEKEKTEVVDTINENDKLNNEELFKKIQEGIATKEEIEAYTNNIATKDDINELKEIIEKYMAATTSAPTPAVTTNYTTALTGTTTYKTTVTSGTTESLKPRTTATHEQRGPVPSNSTTTETTTVYTTVAEQDIISNLNFVEKEDSNELPFVTINVSNKYIATASGGSTISGEGEGMYWPAHLYEKVSGKNNYAALDEIHKLNPESEDYILGGHTIDVPFTTYYCSGKSVYEVSEKTGIDVNKIIELNRIDNIKEVSDKEKEYLVMISKEKLDSYTNIEGTKMFILDNGLVVAADRVEKVSNTTYLTYHQIDKNQNFVNSVYINGKNATITPFAKNVEDITKNGIICSKNTEIYLFNTMAVYTNGTDILVSVGQLPINPNGYEYVGHKESNSNQKKLSLFN